MRDDTKDRRFEGVSNRLIIRLEHDPDTENPLECDRWELRSFINRHSAYTDPDSLFTVETGDYRTIPNLGMRRKLATGTAFLLDYFEHGNSRWDIRGTGPSCPWDTSRNAGVLVWTGKPEEIGKTYPDRRKYATVTLETYNDWSNGSCYWFSIETGNGEDLESCGGFIGWGDDSGMKEELQWTIEDYRSKHSFDRVSTKKLAEDPATGEERVLYLKITGEAKYLANGWEWEKKEAKKAA
jgi:hypothetical protein